VTADEGRTLRAGDRVRFVTRADCFGNCTVGGRVIRVGPRCIEVEWDDGDRSAVHPDDMDRFSREVPR